MNTKRIIFIGLSLFGLCLPALAIQDSTIVLCKNTIHKDSLYNHILRLQNFGTRYTFSENRKTIAEYVAHTFRTIGIPDVVLDSFQISDSSFKSTPPYSLYWQYNVIATIPGSNQQQQEILMVTSHYDAIAKESVTNTPGADDNGSGMAGMFEIARSIIKNKVPFKSTVKFIAFAAEEIGVKGSSDYVTKAFNSKLNIKFVCNLDMLAWTIDTNKAQWTLNLEVYDQSKKSVPFIFRAIAKYSTIKVAYHGFSNASDSYPFSQKDFNAVWFVENYGSEIHPKLSKHPYYHTIHDRVENYDLRYCTELVKAISSIVLFADDSLSTEQLSQTITFDSLPTKTYGDSAFLPRAIASSGLRVKFVSSDTNIIKILDDTIASIKGIGQAEIIAYHDGDALYKPADPQKRTITVLKRTVQFELLNLSTVYSGTIQHATIKTSPAQVKVKVIYSSISKNDTIEPIHAGLYAITVMVDDTNYLGQKSDTLIITKAPLTILADTISKLYGDSIPLFTYRYKGFVNNETEAVISVKPNITCAAQKASPVGTYPIVLSSTKAVDYECSHIPAALIIRKAPQTITFFPLPKLNMDALKTVLTAYSSSGLAVAYISSNPSIATVAFDTLVFVSTGTVEIIATQPGNENYEPAQPKTQLVTIEKATGIFQSKVTQNGTKEYLLIYPSVCKVYDEKILFQVQSPVAITYSSLSIYDALGTLIYEKRNVHKNRIQCSIVDFKKHFTGTTFCAIVEYSDGSSTLKYVKNFFSIKNNE